MYHLFYHLKQDPFADAPDLDFLFLSPSHKAALQAIIQGIAGPRGGWCFSARLDWAKPRSSVPV